MRRMWLLISLGLLLATGFSRADVLDADSPVNPLLESVSTALHDAGFDVAYNLNVPKVANTEPRRPRLGALADLPPLRLPLTPELLEWEAAFARGEIGALAWLPGSVAAPVLEESPDFAQFHDVWLDASAQERVFISWHVEDAQLIESLRTALSNGRAVGIRPQQVEQAGRLYATAGQRFVVDTEAARDYAGAVTEFQLLGEQLRRGSASVLNPESRDARRLSSREPEVFLKEGLGDEFEASTIPEIIVPGGIAFGEDAVFKNELVQLIFESDRLWLQDAGGQRFSLPAEDVGTWKASFDFAARSEIIGSDAVVDIDERSRVRISSALEDTDAGVELIRIDTEPFKYVQRLDVRKSVIIDTEVNFFVRDAYTEFATEYEVRFLQADSVRIARTQAAVVYRYESATQVVEHVDIWGPDGFRLKGRTDFEGLGSSTANAARHAAWVALFRSALNGELDFSRGRYEFMKVDKAGRSTPSRL
ncbi:MAG: hypothetical protein Q7V56_07705 [Gammaproteobacteria bacterium]|nr:hypothetical protein [Gammaproteobacteria bacterium]